MGMSIMSVGNRVTLAPLQELPQDRGSSRRAQIQAAQQRAAAVERIEASLPGNRDSNGSNTQEIVAAAADLERIGMAFNKKLQFVVDHQSNQVTVKVIDRETDKVIKVLPPEELQRLHSKLKETIGFLFDERV
jgi:flagellar protein FlaG